MEKAEKVTGYAIKFDIFAKRDNVKEQTFIDLKTSGEIIDYEIDNIGVKVTLSMDVYGKHNGLMLHEPISITGFGGKKFENTMESTVSEYFIKFNQCVVNKKRLRDCINVNFLNASVVADEIIEYVIDDIGVKMVLKSQNVEKMLHKSSSFVHYDGVSKFIDEENMKILSNDKENRVKKISEQIERLQHQLKISIELRELWATESQFLGKCFTHEMDGLRYYFRCVRVIENDYLECVVFTLDGEQFGFSVDRVHVGDDVLSIPISLDDYLLASEKVINKMGEFISKNNSL